MTRTFRNKIYQRTIYVAAAAMFLVSCAQIVAPGGGPADRTPPRVVKYLPDSARLNFDAKNITIAFDEYVQLKDLTTQLIISPPMERRPDIAVHGKTLSIILDKDEQLKSNTTYSISFGNSVQDLNENNPIENFKYIFSTGSYIDSLSVRGIVEDAFTHRRAKGITVMLFTDMSDSAVYKHPPDYFAKTSDDGGFQISNVRQANYRLIALKDLNADYRYNEGEQIAFVKDTVFPALKKNYTLELFEEPPSKIFLKKYIHDEYGRVELIFNHGTDSIRVTALNNTDKGVQEFLEHSFTKDSATYRIKNFTKDTLKLQISNGNIPFDTVEIKMISLEDAMKSKKHPWKLRLTGNPDGRQDFDPNMPLTLTFSELIAEINPKVHVQLTEDSVKMKDLLYDKTAFAGPRQVVVCAYDSTIQIESPDKPGVFISAPTLFSRIIRPAKKYHLVVPAGAFTDVFGRTNDSLNISFRSRELKYYGTLAVNIKNPDSIHRYVLQLLDDKEKVVEEGFLKGNDRFEYSYLHPGKYTLRLIQDLNENDKWDSGNFLKKIQPEKVIYHTETIMIRSNWDAENDWQLQ